MADIDSTHVFTLTIDGVNRWPLVALDSVRMTDAEGSEVDTLSFSLDDPAANLTVTNWDVVIWIADGTTYLFGGYVTSVTATPNESKAGRTLAVNCEGYVTRCHKTDVIAAAYADMTPGAIVTALFAAAGISDFDIATYLTAGSAGNPFVVDYGLLGEALDRLALREGWVWRVDAQKKLHFGPASSDAAAFGAADEANADYSAYYPASDASYTLTANEIKNKIIVHGGYHDSALQTDSFNGDGSTKLFNLSQNRINKIHEITVGGVLQRYGTDGWHGSSLAGTIDSGYQVLVNHTAGYVWFYTAPTTGTNNVVVKFLYSTPLTWTKTDAASVTKFGLTFTSHVYDTNLAAAAEADDMMTAILADYADEVVQGSFTVRRLGLRAAQQVNVNIAPLGINGSYTIRNVEYGMFAPGRLECRATFGGRSLRLSQIMNREQAQPYEPQTGPAISGDVNDMRVWNQFQIGSGIADFGGIT